MNNNTIRCKRLATIVSGRKYAAWPLIRRKLLSTSAYAAFIFRHLCLPIFAWRRSCYVFSTRKNCSESLASYVVIKVLFSHIVYLTLSRKKFFIYNFKIGGIISIWFRTDYFEINSITKSTVSASWCNKQRYMCCRIPPYYYDSS